MRHVPMQWTWLQKSMTHLYIIEASVQRLEKKSTTTHAFKWKWNDVPFDGNYTETRIPKASGFKV